MEGRADLRHHHLRRPPRRGHRRRHRQPYGRFGRQAKPAMAFSALARFSLDGNHG